MTPQTIPTTSLWAAAYAMVRGVRLLDVLPRNGRLRNTLVLDNTGDRAHESLHEYWQGNPVANVRDILDARMDLLDRLYQVEQTSSELAREA